MEMPLVSAIIPVYNGEKVIGRCVDSLLKQTYKNLEIIVVNDGSKDHTKEVLDAYNDPRLRVIHKENSGVSATRNLALKEARGTYIQFLDADDYVSSDATFLLVERALATNADLVISDFYRVIKDRVSHKGDIASDAVLSKREYALYMLDKPADYYYGVLWNKLYKREIIEKYDVHMDANVSFCEDFMFNLEYVRHCERIVALRIPYYYYIKTEGSLVAKNMNVQSVVNTRKNVFEYYKAFYKEVFERADYEEIRLQVYRFLVEVCRDEMVLPVFSDKLGDERITIKEEFTKEDTLLNDFYLERKLLYRSIEPLSLKYGLNMEASLVLLALADGKKTREELKELLDYNAFKLEAAISLLFVKSITWEDGDYVSIQDEGVKELLAILIKQIDDVRYASLSEEEIKEFNKLQAKVNKAIKEKC